MKSERKDKLNCLKRNMPLTFKSNFKKYKMITTEVRRTARLLTSS